MIYYNKVSLKKGIDLTKKGKTARNVYFVPIGILIMGLNFKNHFVMVVMIC